MASCSTHVIPTLFFLGNILKSNPFQAITNILGGWCIPDTSECNVLVEQTSVMLVTRLLNEISKSSDIPY